MNLFYAVYGRKRILNKIHWKNNKKHKVEKTKKYIRNSQNNKIHRKKIMFWQFFLQIFVRNIKIDIFTKN